MANHETDYLDALENWLDDNREILEPNKQDDELAPILYWVDLLSN
jgi:hypothetical protein